MTEDHIYEAEFDALRDRPSGTEYCNNSYTLFIDSEFSLHEG